MSDGSGTVKMIFGMVVGAGVVGLLVVAVVGGIWLGRRTAPPAVVTSPYAATGSMTPAGGGAVPDLNSQVASLEDTPVAPSGMNGTTAGGTADAALAAGSPQADVNGQAPGVVPQQPQSMAVNPPAAGTQYPPAQYPPGQVPQYSAAQAPQNPPPSYDYRNMEQAYAPEAQPVSVDVNVFAQDLQPMGEWVEVPEYQHCWRPRGIASGWRPYTVGHWVYTDYGWTWYSDERWGSICYHYGSWVEDPRYGWVWVPGRVWAPAWVAWRSGSDCMGWAPLPPRYCTGRRPVLAVDVEIIPASAFCFVDARLVMDPHLDRHVRRREENVTIIKKTVNVTNINVTNNVVINRSVDVTYVEKVTNKKVERVAIAKVSDEREAEKLKSQGKPVIYAPPPAPAMKAASVKPPANGTGALIPVPAKHGEAVVPVTANNQPAVITEAEKKRQQALDQQTKQHDATVLKQQEAEQARQKVAEPPRQPIPGALPPVAQDAAENAKQAAWEKAKADALAKQQDAERVKADQAAKQKAADQAKADAAEKVKQEAWDKAKADALAKQQQAEQAAKQKAADQAKTDAALLSRQDADRIKQQQQADALKRQQDATVEAAKDQAAEQAKVEVQAKQDADRAKQAQDAERATAAEQARQDAAADRARAAEQAKQDAADRAQQAQDAADRARRDRSKVDPSTTQPANNGRGR